MIFYMYVVCAAATAFCVCLILFSELLLETFMGDAGLDTLGVPLFDKEMIISGRHRGSMWHAYKTQKASPCTLK